MRGNEAADKLAKEAAQGRLSRQVDLPHLLRSQLPVSASTTKQHFNNKLNKMWTKIQAVSPRKIRFMHMDPDFPFNNFQRKLFNLSRQQASIIMQIQTGHIPLNFYLKQIGKLESDKCLKCAKGPVNAQVTETISHYIFECQVHDEARQSLIAKIRRRSFNINKLMKNTDYMKALVTFINRTGRLKDNT